MQGHFKWIISPVRCTVRRDIRRTYSVGPTVARDDFITEWRKFIQMCAAQCEVPIATSYANNKDDYWRFAVNV